MTSDSKAVCGGGENQAARWLPIETAPTDRPVVVRMRTDRLSGGWFVATVTLPDPEDESRFAGSSTIWHYNGDILMSRFRGMWTHWLCDETAALASTAGAGDWVTVREDITGLIYAALVHDLGYASKEDAAEQWARRSEDGGLYIHEADLAESLSGAIVSRLSAVPASPRSGAGEGEEISRKLLSAADNRSHALSCVTFGKVEEDQINEKFLTEIKHALLGSKVSPPAPAEHGVEIRELHAALSKGHALLCESGPDRCWVKIGFGWLQDAQDAHGALARFIKAAAPAQSPSTSDREG